MEGEAVKKVKKKKKKEKKKRDDVMGDEGMGDMGDQGMGEMGDEASFGGADVFTVPQVPTERTLDGEGHQVHPNLLRLDDHQLGQAEARSLERAQEAERRAAAAERRREEANKAVRAREERQRKHLQLTAALTQKRAGLLEQRAALMDIVKSKGLGAPHPLAGVERPSPEEHRRLQVERLLIEQGASQIRLAALRDGRSIREAEAEGAAVREKAYELHQKKQEELAREREEAEEAEGLQQEQQWSAEQKQSHPAGEDWAAGGGEEGGKEGRPVGALPLAPPAMSPTPGRRSKEPAHPDYFTAEEQLQLGGQGGRGGERRDHLRSSAEDGPLRSSAEPPEERTPFHGVGRAPHYATGRGVEVEELRQHIGRLADRLDVLSGGSPEPRRSRRDASRASRGARGEDRAARRARRAALASASPAPPGGQLGPTPVPGEHPSDMLPGLPAELRGDEELREQLVAHKKEMMQLHLQIERERKQAELDSMRDQLARIKADRAAAALHAEGRDRGGAETGYDLTEYGDDVMEEGEAEGGGTAGGGQSGEDSDMGSETSAGASGDDDGPRGAEYVEGQVVEVDVEDLAPLRGLQGHVRVMVVLYEGYQPVQAGQGAVVRAATSAHDVSGRGSTSWREVVSLPGVEVGPSTSLVFELHLKRPDKAGQPGREEVVAWGSAPVMDEESGEVAGETQRAPLCRLPIMLSAERRFAFEGAPVLSFRVRVTEARPGMMDTFHQPRPMDTPRGQHAAPLEDWPGVPVVAWRKVRAGVPPLDTFQHGDGFVLRVDGARFLPQNVTVTKVVASIYTGVRTMLTPAPLEAACDLDCSATSPVYNVKHRVSTSSWNDPTATIVFQVTTVEADSGHYRVVGYAALACFADPVDGAQPDQPSFQDYVLNQGVYQLPLYTRGPRLEDLEDSEDIFCEASFEDQPRLHCASLLVRVQSTLQAEVERESAAKHLPDYQRRVYDSMRCLPTPTEVKLYARRLAQEARSVRSAVSLLVGAEEARSMSDYKMRRWIEWALRKPDLANDLSMNLNKTLKYAPEFGFHAAIDAANKLPKAAPAFAVYSLAPPAVYYGDRPLTEDVDFTHAHDPEAPLEAPIWLDGFKSYRDVVYEPNLLLLIDVRHLFPDKGTSQPVGWAALPIFERSGEFVATGAYQLPLFQGVPTRALLDELEHAPASEVLAGALKAKRIRYTSTHSSVYVRLLDDQRWGEQDEAVHAHQGAPKVPSYVTPKVAAQLRKNVRGKRTYEGAAGKGGDWEDFQLSINEEFASESGILHYDKHELQAEDWEGDESDESEGEASGGGE